MGKSEGRRQEGGEGKRWEGESEREGVRGKGEELRGEPGTSWLGQGARASSHPTERGWATPGLGSHRIGASLPLHPCLSSWGR